MIEKYPRLDIVSVQTLPKEHQTFLDDDTEDSTAAAASKFTTLRSLSQVKPRPEIKTFWGYFGLFSCDTIIKYFMHKFPNLDALYLVDHGKRYESEQVK